MSTGKSWQFSRRKSAERSSSEVSDQMESMQSYQEVPKLMNTSGKNLPEFKDLSLNLERNPFEGTKQKIGTRFGSLLLRTIYPASLAMFELCITGPSAVLLLIMEDLLQWKEKSGSSGEKLVLENPAEPGRRRDWTLTLKIPEPSSGMAMLAMKMLSSMSFEEELMFPICSDGWIAIRSSWKSKARQSYFERRQYGLPRIFLPTDGIQILTKPLWKLSSED